MRTSLALPFAVLAALPLLAGCGDSGPGPVTVQGSVTLGHVSGAPAFTWDTPGRGSRFDCAGRGEYADVRPGGPVVVKDADGAAVAIGRLGAGTATLHHEPDLGRDVADSCTMPFTARDVPYSRFYTVQAPAGAAKTVPAGEAQAGVRLTAGAVP